MIVGGYAVAFGFEKHTLHAEKFSDKKNILKFGVEPVRVDLLNDIDGVDFAEIENRAVRGKYGDILTRFIGKTDLITNKKSSGRLQDLADLEKLQE